MDDNSYIKHKDLSEQLRKRTKAFAIRIVKLYRALPKTGEARVIGNQMLKSGTSVAANYRAVCRARSKAEFIAKMCIVVEEADETVFWLEMIVDTGIMPVNKLKDLMKEADELLRIFSASRRTERNSKR